jgi:hypothetical protein
VATASAGFAAARPWVQVVNPPQEQGAQSAFHVDLDGSPRGRFMRGIWAQSTTRPLVKMKQYQYVYSI